MFDKSFLQRLQLLLIFCFPLFWLGIGARYPWVLLGEYGIDIGYICFFILTLSFFILTLLKIDKWLLEHAYKVFLLMIGLATFFVLFYDLAQYKNFERFGYKLPILLYVIDAINLVVVGFILKKFSFKYLFLCCCIFFILHECISIVYFPLTPLRSDMLPAIDVAITNFLANQSPYKQLFANIGIPRYFPLTWVSYLPAHFLSIDFRVWGLFYYILTLLIIALNFDKLPKINQYLLCLLFLSPYFLMRHDLYFQLYLLEIVVLAFYIEVLPKYLNAIILGIFIATLQFAWVLYPFLLLIISKNIRQLVINWLISILAFIFIMWLFIGGSFIDFLSYSTPSMGKNSASGFYDISFSLATIFHFASTYKILYFIQIVSFLVIVLITLFRWYSKNIVEKPNYLAIGLYAYLFFVATNYFLETYFYIPVLLLGALIKPYNKTPIL